MKCLPICLLLLTVTTLRADDPASFEVTMFDTAAPGWRQLDGDDFVRVNGDDQTLVWTGGVAQGSGTPIGVTRTKDPVTNFELVIEWMHQKPAGNSGVFAWVPIEALAELKPGELPRTGIEVQMLDHGYTEKAAAAGRPTDWFTSNGDIFPVANSTMKPFPPLSPNGSRSFPTAQTTNGAGQWNQYYVRGINGEIRLWVNGTEVSGGRDCNPASGHLCLESEGSPIQFRNIYLRELP